MKVDPNIVVLPDEGCHLHPSCLSCPRPVCWFDEREGQRERDRQHLAEMAVSLRSTGMSIREIARSLSRSTRVVQRYLSDAR